MSDLVFYKLGIVCIDYGTLYHTLDTLQIHYSFPFVPVIYHWLIGLIDFSVFLFTLSPKDNLLFYKLYLFCFPLRTDTKKRGTFSLIGI